MLCFAQSDRPRSLKKALNVLRAGVWFEGLRIRLHQSTAYGVGQRLQPHTYRDGLYHHNVWAKYAVGKHLPSAETVYACEQQVPRSSYLLEDPSWDLLDVSRPIGGDGDKLLKRLRPSIQSALFEERALAMGRYVRRTAPAKTNRTGRAQRVTTRTSYTLATRCIHGHRHPRCTHCMFLPQHEVPHGHL